MSVFSAIDLSALPVGGVIETVDPIAIRAELEGIVRALYPDLADPLANSDPIAHLLDALTQRETHWRNRVNEAAHGVLLPSAMGNDLTQLGALLGVSRKPNESDAAYRFRIQLAPEAYTTAGSVGAYQFHALSVDGVRDVSIDTPHFVLADITVPSGVIALDVDYDANLDNPRPGDVAVTILPDSGMTGDEEEDLIPLVEAALDARSVVPINDRPRVRLAEPKAFIVRATLDILQGPSAHLVMESADLSVRDYLRSINALGREATRSGLIAALKVNGVHDLVLHEPETNITVGSHQLAQPEQIILQQVSA